MSDIEYDWASRLLHLWNASVVDDEILITECRSTVGEHYLIVATLDDFLCCKLHCIGSRELALLDVDHLA